MATVTGPPVATMAVPPVVFANLRLVPMLNGGATWQQTQAYLTSVEQANTAEFLLEPGSVGLALDGTTAIVTDVHRGGQACRQGIKRGMRVETVDGQEYSAAVFRDAVSGSKPYEIVMTQVCSYIDANGRRSAAKEFMCSKLQMEALSSSESSFVDSSASSLSDIFSRSSSRSVSPLPEHYHMPALDPVQFTPRQWTPGHKEPDGDHDEQQLLTRWLITATCISQLYLVIAEHVHPGADLGIVHHLQDMDVHGLGHSLWSAKNVLAEFVLPVVGLKAACQTTRSPLDNLQFYSFINFIDAIALMPPKQSNLISLGLFVLGGATSWMLRMELPFESAQSEGQRPDSEDKEVTEANEGSNGSVTQ